MIIFQNVTKEFSVGAPALRDVSFSIDEGEFVFLTGHSGAGKTTIARLLTKEYEPTEGSITFFGDPLEDIPRSKIHQHRRRIGVIYQDYKLLHDMTVYENIALALQILGKKKDEIDQRVEDLLELVQLHDKLELFPSQLSGGEAQRVSIARALATAPGVLFADEPTGNLDPKTSEHIFSILKKINEIGTTVIMSTHSLEFLENTPHRVLTLSEGQMSVKEPKNKPAKKKVVKEPEDESSDKKDHQEKESKQKPAELEIELPKKKESDDE